ncbi:retrotransposable element Tf2 protein type 1 [Elysia marginata]|uniref:Retrotransposable element Tf2 protein type 1 n=1 Tax=Elysia marginata TaxID=1093978 RepID=A0AAV4GVN5_9GAST|nr:retrotransposable element Tf2 protein type 1 [Elysia marginata]
MLHDGHLGIVKMKNLARKLLLVARSRQGHREYVKAVQRLCYVVTRSTSNTSPSMAIPCKAMAADSHRLCGSISEPMFLVIVDAHTKWVDIIPTTMSTTSTTVNILGTIFARFGIPEQVVTRQRPSVYVRGIQDFHVHQQYQACSQCTLSSGYKRNRRAYGAKF